MKSSYAAERRAHRNELLAKLRRIDAQICEGNGLILGNWAGILKHYKQEDMAIIEECIDNGTVFTVSFMEAFKKEALSRAVENMILD